MRGKRQLQVSLSKEGICLIEGKTKRKKIRPFLGFREPQLSAVWHGVSVNYY